MQRAVAVRTARDADTLLAGWQAVAEGMVRFAVVVGHGTNSAERVIRADQLRVEVYGEAPNRSKQEIVAWRDTTFAPTDIVYHRDHLGVVANDFGATIRLGEGDEVRDVPHPLSPAGLQHYEFAVADTVSVSGPGAAVRVVAVHVRPRDPASAGTVGTLYLDAERAALVRFHFTFTAPSYRDATVAAIVVNLENAFLDGQRWLPWRQSITIRREGPVFALPLYTLLRADWTISGYALGVTHPPDRFRGSLVGGLRAPGDSGFATPVESILAELPATERSLEAVVALVSGLAPEARLTGMPRLRLLGEQGLSSLLRVNRVQGVTPGAGARVVLDDAHQLDLALAYGTSDKRLTGQAALHRLRGSFQGSVTVGRDVIDAGGGAFGSGMMNSLITTISGDDAGDWLLRDLFVDITLRGRTGKLAWETGATVEETRSVRSRFTAIDGTRRANPELGVGRVQRAGLRVGSPGDRRSGRWHVEGEYGRAESRGLAWGRVEASLDAVAGPLHWRIGGGIATPQVPAYRSFTAGGRGSLVGVPNRAIGGRRLIRAEVAVPLVVGVPAPGVSGLVRSVLASRLTPYLAAAVADGDVAGAPWRATGAVVPVVGVRLDLWGPLLRLDLGWALREGRLGLVLDAHPDWWAML